MVGAVDVWVVLVAVVLVPIALVVVEWVLAVLADEAALDAPATAPPLEVAVEAVVLLGFGVELARGVVERAALLESGLVVVIAVDKREAGGGRASVVDVEDGLGWLVE